MPDEQSDSGDFTDDRRVDRCICGWGGRWDYAMAHLAEHLGEDDHRIIDERAEGC